MNESSPNLLAFTIALNGYDSLFASCIATQNQYFQKHLRIDQLVISQFPAILSPTESAWLKLLIALRALQSYHYDWVAFVDADCDIRDHTPSFIDDFTTNYPKKNIFFAHGFSGRINSGVFFICNSAASIRFLKQVLDHADSEVPPEDRAPYENGHVISFGKKNPHIQIIDFNRWNNNSKLDPSSYIQHYSGGVLRPWYMRNRAPNRHKHIISYWSHKVFRIARRLLFVLGLRGGAPGKAPVRGRAISVALREMESHVDSILKKHMAVARKAEPDGGGNA